MRYLVTYKDEKEGILIDNENSLIILLLKLFMDMKLEDQRKMLNELGCTDEAIDIKQPLNIYFLFLNNSNYDDLVELNSSLNNIGVFVQKIENDGQINLL